MNSGGFNSKNHVNIIWNCYRWCSFLVGTKKLICFFVELDSCSFYFNAVTLNLRDLYHTNKKITNQKVSLSLLNLWYDIWISKCFTFSLHFNHLERYMSCSPKLHLSITLESYLSHLVGYLFPLVVRHHIALTVPTLLLLHLSVWGLSLVMGPVRTQKQCIHSSY